MGMSLAARSATRIRAFDGEDIMKLIFRDTGFWFVALCAALLGPLAHATIIRGSFDGRAVNVYGNPFTVQEGDPVSGNFYLDTSYPYERSSASTPTLAYYSFGTLSAPTQPPPPLGIAIYAPQNAYELAGPIVEIQMAQDAVSQQVTLITGYGSFCCAASLTLSGASGSLFDTLDPASLHPGPVDFGDSSASWASKGTLNFDVAFSRFAFDPAAVPEPASLPLLAVALGGAALTGRRRGARHRVAGGARAQ